MSRSLLPVFAVIACAGCAGLQGPAGPRGATTAAAEAPVPAHRKELKIMRASALSEPGVVIELIGYEISDEVDREAFSAAWRAAFDRAPWPAGLLYRDLSMQRPDWTEKVRAEIMNPNPFVFLEYAVFRSSADQTAYRATGGGPPRGLPGNPQVTEGSFTISSRFVRTDAPGEPGMLLYNLFMIQGGEKVVEGFASRWPERAQHQSQQEGFYSAILHRQAAPEQMIAAFNRAGWQDADRYAKTLAEFERKFPRSERGAVAEAPRAGPPPVRSHIGLFEVLHSLP
jgi:hypothetical protein